MSADPWKRLAELEQAGASEAWERAGLVARLIEENWSTRDVAGHARERGLRSIASIGRVTQLHGWHRLIEAAGLFTTVNTLPERAVRPVTSAGLPLKAQVRALKKALAGGALDKEWLLHQVQVERAALDHLWDDDQRARATAADAGQTVIANQKTDLGLVAWARAKDRFVAIDRGSPWGNPFVLDEDGDRDRVIELYADHYLPFKALDAAGLAGGKVLGCWCYPDPCHGNVLLERVGVA